MKTSSHEPDSDQEQVDTETDSADAATYEPPQVEALGTLPASTGMPASPQTFPDDPTR